MCVRPQRYIQTFKYGNADAEELWDAISEVRGWDSRMEGGQKWGVPMFPMRLGTGSYVYKTYTIGQTIIETVFVIIFTNKNTFKKFWTMKKRRIVF